jgi:KipI family sensor histidine kinase inhibitor
VRLLPAGPDAVLVEVGSAREAARLYAEVRAADLAVRDVVPAARTLLLDGIDDRDAVTRFLAGCDLGAENAPAPAQDPVELPVRYDGPDLDDVARHWGMTRDEAVATHTGTVFTVAFLGFAPGFAYCTGLPDGLAVPRLDSPRQRVEPGSVGVAGEFTGVYPSASPGGWRLLGRTDARLWQPDRDPPALLTPGDTVRFVEAS